MRFARAEERELHTEAVRLGPTNNARQASLIFVFGKRPGDHGRPEGSTSNKSTKVPPMLISLAVPRIGGPSAVRTRHRDFYGDAWVRSVVLPRGSAGRSHDCRITNRERRCFCILRSRGLAGKVGNFAGTRREKIQIVTTACGSAVIQGRRLRCFSLL